MCTVSFISKNNTYYITSNRDEHRKRPASLEPKVEVINGIKILYPKDPKAGGTWFAINNKGVAVVLLNGAFTKHISKGPYKMSRGLIVLNTASAENSLEYAARMDLEGVEPFTLVLFQGKKLVEIRWNGTEKSSKELGIHENHIWSSATLYDTAAIKKRETLFTKFLATNRDHNGDSIIDFHRNNNEDYENGFVIDRDTGLKTFSITQAVIDVKGAVLDHLDLQNEKRYSMIIPEEQPQDLLS